MKTPSSKQPTSSQPLVVLYEDNHLLAVNKPAGLPTMGVGEDKPSLLKSAKEYIREKYNKPGNVYLGTVSRLDAPTTGVVLFARTSKAADRLSGQFRDRRVEKLYLAVVEGEVEVDEAECEHYVRKHERHRRVEVCTEQTPGAQLAKLSFKTLARKGACSQLAVQLQTGRKHQIRVQLADLGHPILGDRKYGAARKFPLGIALHARRLVVEHPTQREPVTIEAPLPLCWQKWAGAFAAM